MLSSFLCRMANPLRRLRLDQQSAGVLPFRYELVLSNANNANVVLGDRRTLSSAPAEVAATVAVASTHQIEDNPYYAKYADKIKKSQAEKARYGKTNLPNENSKPITVSTTDCNTPNGNEQSSLLDDNRSIISGSSQDNPKLAESTSQSKETAKSQNSNVKLDSLQKKNSKKSLDDIVKLDLLQEKSAEEITQIWNTYHQNKDCIYASIPFEAYNSFYQNSLKYPAFVLPLPRNQAEGKVSEGYEFFLLQFQEHCCYFTPLVAYHLHKEIAPVCLSLYHYPELSQSKGIVLMTGEFDSNILNTMESQCLANQLNYYYSTKDEAAKLSLHLFNNEPKSFDHMRLVRHLEDGILANSIDAINLNSPD